MTKVTVITASYNYAQYIGQTIESVINQTFSDWEMLVVDDGSKDNSIEVISEYAKKDERIKLITHPNNGNRGLVATLQAGIEKSEGEYIVFLESDDYIREDYLEKKLACFDKYPDVGFIYNDVEVFGRKLSLERKLFFNNIRRYWKKHNYPHKLNDIFYIGNCVPTFSCVMLKKEVLSDLDWNSPYKAYTDLWLWVQLSKRTEFYFMADKLTFWRLHDDSYSKTSKIGNAKDIIMFYRQIYGMLSEATDINYKIKSFVRQLILKYKYQKKSIKYE